MALILGNKSKEGMHMSFFVMNVHCGEALVIVGIFLVNLCLEVFVVYTFKMYFLMYTGQQNM